MKAGSGRPAGSAPPAERRSAERAAEGGLSGLSALHSKLHPERAAARQKSEIELEKCKGRSFCEIELEKCEGRSFLRAAPPLAL